ncbi:SGNH/GDSL hydrolase family protein [Pseudaminobacter sp. 19-2017]|uniref:SGNH/GDSL hydrolase family protein n=1 Tax=Pseudaminobacter soli (ex Zhang et al. 2022) TaxID=2831468 RepID=A0A942IBJ8_9HYPH|nr:SGNH/GDSL hydrolase family protein [Pseudaminobacter soli]MBS3652385.1 SGNH/GDSL hydrolase family protein [Pseudaminobacter soli]
MNVWPPDAPIRSIIGQTVREIVRVTAAGQQVILRFTNEFGSHPIQLDAVNVARALAAGWIDTQTAQKATFGGKAFGTISPGAALFSDPIDLHVDALSHLAVSYFTEQYFALATHHYEAQQTCYISEPGNFADAEVMPVQQTTTSHYLLSSVYVQAPKTTGAVVCFGDSITDGLCSTIDADNRWPDIFAERLRGAGIKLAVLNQGIGGNRLLHDCRGVKALERFNRDALTQHGATHLVLLEGINDILWPNTILASGREFVTADEIVAALGQLVLRAKMAGLKVMIGTLLPFENALPDLPGIGFYTPAKEAIRQAVNDFIRNLSGADAVMDFDVLMRDPAQPTRLLPEYDSGDHIHPNDAGYRAMANAIDLEFFA